MAGVSRVLPAGRAGTSGTHGNAAALPIALFGDSTVVSVETAQRLACDCGGVPVHEDARGNPLSVGRKTRSIPSAVKRALLRRDRCCHEYGYRIELDDDGVRFYNPHGLLVRDAPAPARPADLGWAAITRMNAPLDITPVTNAPRWDGEPVNYDWVIEDLCRRDPPS